MAHRSQSSSVGDNPMDPNYLPPHYREEYRLAIDALVEDDDVQVRTGTADSKTSSLQMYSIIACLHGKTENDAYRKMRVDLIIY